jgi:outer membrane protein OmpA-like peptidoglycan-associated protein
LVENNCFQEIVYEPVKNYKNLVIGYKTTVYNVFFDIKKEMQQNGMLNPKDEDYAKYTRLLKADDKIFKIYSQTSYIDTSSFALAYKTKDSVDLKNAVKPIVAKISRHIKKSKEFGSIYFELSKSDFDNKYEKEVEKVAQYLKNNKNVFLELHGYTDSLGSERFNDALSEDRALVVKRMIIKHGIPSERIKAIGMRVEKLPVVVSSKRNKKELEEMLKNDRRVDFIVIKPKKGHSKNK